MYIKHAVHLSKSYIKLKLGRILVIHQLSILPALKYADYYNFSIASIAFLLTMRYKIYALKALGAIINNKIK